MGVYTHRCGLEVRVGQKKTESLSWLGPWWENLPEVSMGIWLKSQWTGISGTKNKGSARDLGIEKGLCSIFLFFLTPLVSCFLKNHRIHLLQGYASFSPFPLAHFLWESFGLWTCEGTWSRWAFPRFSFSWQCFNGGESGFSIGQPAAQKTRMGHVLIGINSQSPLCFRVS